MDVIILAGGKGSRMEDDLPKCLVYARKKTILQRQIDYLSKFSQVKKIILALGYKAGKVVDYVYKNYSDHNIPILFSLEDEPLGTGGAIKKAMNLTESENVLVLNSDDITDIDLNRLTQSEESVICVTHPRLPYGMVFEKEGYAEFEEKPVLNIWVSPGWYYFKKREIIDYLPDKGSIEYDVFPNVKLRLYKHLGFWRTLNSKKDISEFEKEEIPGVLE
jgi:mannose-1-phosphate guanylyltransferase